MAVKVFVSRMDVPCKDKVIENNDAYFEDSKDIESIDETVRHLMINIDGSRYVKDTTMLTRYGDYLDMGYLSTGCKTAINAYNNPDSIINCTEAGGNAILQMLQLKNCQLLLNVAPLNDEVNNLDILVIHGKDRCKCKSSLELAKYLYKLGV